MQGRYHQIQWADAQGETLPQPIPAVHDQPLWPFYQALLAYATKMGQERTDQTLWALAVVSSNASKVASSIVCTRPQRVQVRWW